MVSDEAVDASESLADVAVEVAEAAGRRARDARREGFGVSAKSTPTDLVTAVDTATETWIREQLARRRPGDRVLGEESGERAGRAGTSTAPDAVRWIVDPIDGTVNFALGIPMYAVSVAAEVQGEIVAGCVYNPEADETFRAVRGGGARVRARDRPGQQRTWRRLGERRAVPLSRAVIGTGFGYDQDRRAAQGAAVARLLPRVGDIRRIGAASLDLCAVGAGRLDGYFEAGLNRWDWAAGLLVATEAGCRASGLAGAPQSDRMTVVAAPGLLPELVAALDEVGADVLA